MRNMQHSTKHTKEVLPAVADTGGGGGGVGGVRTHLIMNKIKD